MTDTPAACRSDLRAWAKSKSFVVRCHANVVADNLKRIEREGMPTDPVMIETFERLAKVKNAQ